MGKTSRQVQIVFGGGTASEYFAVLCGRKRKLRIAVLRSISKIRRAAVYGGGAKDRSLPRSRSCALRTAVLGGNLPQIRRAAFKDI